MFLGAWWKRKSNGVLGCQLTTPGVNTEAEAAGHTCVGFLVNAIIGGKKTHLKSYHLRSEKLPQSEPGLLAPALIKNKKEGIFSLRACPHCHFSATRGPPLGFQDILKTS